MFTSKTWLTIKPYYQRRRFPCAACSVVKFEKHWLNKCHPFYRKPTLSLTKENMVVLVNSLSRSPKLPRDGAVRGRLYFIYRLDVPAFSQVKRSLAWNISNTDYRFSPHVDK